jgi:hypothetical protein
VLSRLLLSARTARRLRWRQLAYRPLRRLQARLPAPAAPPAAAVDAGRAAALAEVWAAAGAGEPQARLRHAREVLGGRFELAGHAETLPSVDWTARHGSPLWTYHLHYFDFAVDLAWAWRATGDAAFPRAFEALAEGWMRQTAGARGPGWEAYPVSLRTANWARARALFGGALDPAFTARLDASLHAQLAFLERRLEWQVMANHLQKNLHALALGGLLFTGAPAARWRARGTELLWSQLFEQVLDDGVHFERSPMYHAVALGDFVEIVALMDACGFGVPDAARERVRRMAAAWTRLSRPGGIPHLFNDGGEDGAPPAPWLDALAERALGSLPPRPRGAWALPEGGFFGWEGDGERIVVDCGAPGPGYQPGHAHCDALSFELDLGGARVVVDSGTRGYEGDPLRAWQRSTRAHSTVEIAGREQSEVWGTFRVARMAQVRAVEVPREGEDFRLTGEVRPFHDRRALHRRTITREGAGAWRVADRVEGAGGAPLRSFLHLHPDWEVRVEGARAEAVTPGGAVAIEAFGADRLRVVRGEREPAQGWYSPRFGAAFPAPVLVLEVDANRGDGFGWRVRAVAR